MQVSNLRKKVDDGNLLFTDFTDTNRKILNSLNKSILLGSGAVGKVYLVNNKYAVKEVSACKADVESNLYKYCIDLNKVKDAQGLDSQIPTIPGGNGKHRYVLPNLLSEILNGMFLGSMKESVSFVPTVSSYIRNNDVYIVMDAQQRVIENRRINSSLQITGNNPKNFIYMLFQISHALMTAQEKYRFTHYDLHIENILWSSLNKNYISYPIPNTNNNLIIDSDNCPFILKISDFALARLETENAIISPSIDTFPVKSYGEFHPSYDILSFIGAILIDNKYRQYFIPLFSNNIDLYRFMLIFTLWVLNERDIKLRRNMTYIELENIRNAIGNKYYTKIGTQANKFNFRPQLLGDFIPYSTSKSMVAIVSFLGKIMVAKNYAKINNTQAPNMIYLNRLSNVYKEYNQVFTYTPDIPLNISGFLERKQSVGDFKEMIIDESIKVVSYHFLANVKPKPFNFTIENEQISSCPIQEHYLTAIFVRSGYENNYTFNFDCCKLDPANYLLQTDKLGFIINGTFFAIKDDFLPIGNYKDAESSINKYKIPEQYKDVFRYVVLKNNKLTIEKDLLIDEDVQLFGSGPILIENNLIVFNPNEKRFACTDEKHAGNTTISLDEDTITTSGYYKYSATETGNGSSCQREFIPNVQTYPRCDKIKPGELSHADNPNPRSAFCILSNGDYIFITVEGRSRRGVGFDLYSLSQTILKSFPNVISAINLDGGRSSNMAWRSSFEPNKVYISNPDHFYPYPVGNILSLTQNS